jgi:hypothetical protein
MDTRFWGPSGWQLLHLIATDETAPAESKKTFFENLEFILPCRFCRESTSKFMKELPYDGRHPAHWLWKFHGLVNSKLRKQHEEGLIQGSDPPSFVEPSFESVDKSYKQALASSSEKPPGNVLPGQDFLSAVLYNAAGSHLTSEEKEEQKKAYHAWFQALFQVFPYQKTLRKTLAEAKPITSIPFQKDEVVAWGFATLRSVCKKHKLRCLFASLKSMCSICAHYTSKCNGKTYRGKTCRSVQRTARVKPGQAKTVRIKPRDPVRVRSFVRGRLMHLMPL